MILEKHIVGGSDLDRKVGKGSAQNRTELRAEGENAPQSFGEGGG